MFFSSVCCVLTTRRWNASNPRLSALRPFDKKWSKNEYFANYLTTIVSEIEKRLRSWDSNIKWSFKNLMKNNTTKCPRNRNNNNTTHNKNSVSTKILLIKIFCTKHSNTLILQRSSGISNTKIFRRQKLTQNTEVFNIDKTFHYKYGSYNSKRKHFFRNMVEGKSHRNKTFLNLYILEFFSW